MFKVSNSNSISRHSQNNPHNFTAMRETRGREADSIFNRKGNDFSTRNFDDFGERSRSGRFFSSRDDDDDKRPRRGLFSSIGDMFKRGDGFLKGLLGGIFDGGRDRYEDYREEYLERLEEYREDYEDRLEDYREDDEDRFEDYPGMFQDLNRPQIINIEPQVINPNNNNGPQIRYV